jgi:hypothetical protein
MWLKREPTGGITFETGPSDSSDGKRKHEQGNDKDNYELIIRIES